MKRIILLTICTTLLLTGCGQTTVPDADTSPTMAQEEAIPATNTQDAPMVAAGATSEVASEVPTPATNALCRTAGRICGHCASRAANGRRTRTNARTRV